MATRATISFYTEDVISIKDKKDRFKEYESEFEVVDGLNQHKDGLTYEQWEDEHYGLND